MDGIADGSRHPLRRDFLAVEVVAAHIARMRDVNPKLNAVVVDLSEDALKAAKAADNARAKQREPGLLHGVPITIKENVDYEGRPNPQRGARADEYHRALRRAGRAQSSRRPAPSLSA